MTFLKISREFINFATAQKCALAGILDANLGCRVFLLNKALLFLASIHYYALFARASFYMDD